MKTIIPLALAAIVLLSMAVDVFSEDIYLPLIRVELPGVSTATQTATSTSTPESTATGTQTPTATATSTATATATATATETQTPTPTQTATATQTQTPTATATQPVGGPCPCNADTLNCSDFDTQPEAQACFDWCISQGAGDIHRLDFDNDGEACESLPPFSRVLR